MMRRSSMWLLCLLLAACGEYLTRAQPVLVTVDRDLTALDFLVNDESPVGPLVTPGADPDDTRDGIRRTPVMFVE